MVTRATTRQYSAVSALRAPFFCFDAVAYRPGVVIADGREHFERRQVFGEELRYGHRRAEVGRRRLREVVVRRVYAHGKGTLRTTGRAGNTDSDCSSTSWCVGRGKERNLLSPVQMANSGFMCGYCSNVLHKNDIEYTHGTA